METDKLPRYNHLCVEITSRCNLRCKTCLYCYYEPQWDPQDLSQEAFDRVKTIAERCHSIHLQGWGESLLRGDCPTLIQTLKELGPLMSLGSNGTIMSRSLAKELLDAGLDSMSFSIAGISAAYQDPLRGEGTFDKAIQSIKCFVDCRTPAKTPPILINYLLTPANIKRLPQAMSLCAKLGVDTLQPTHMVHMADPYQADLATYHFRTMGRWSVFRSRLAVLWTRVGLVMPSVKPNLVPVCAKYPVENAFVGADGSVSPCAYLNPPLTGSYPRLHNGREVKSSRLIMGNLNHDDLDTIWKRSEYQAFRQAFKKRITVYKEQMAGITPDLEGMERLQKGVDRLQHLFETQYQAPEPCRICPHLLGL